VTKPGADGGGLSKALVVAVMIQPVADGRDLERSP
jgi:hypothetical protein